MNKRLFNVGKIIALSLAISLFLYTAYKDYQMNNTILYVSRILVVILFGINLVSEVRIFFHASHPLNILGPFVEPQ